MVGIFSGYCEIGYTLFGGSCYGYNSTELPFYEAEAECNKLPGGHLAAFHTQVEFSFILSIIP